MQALAPLAAALARLAVDKCAERRFALAFSGGMDSRFLAFAARRLGFAPHLLHVRGPHLAPEESARARAWARRHAFPLTELEADPLRLEAVAHNRPERCYACKKMLFGLLLEATPLPLADGSNADDRTAHRPGRRALEELGVASPLAAAGLSKARIYALAVPLGLDDPAQPPRPCLLTRLPYDTPVRLEVLQALARGEAAVAAVLRACGWYGVDFRLRLLASGRCVLHVPRQACPGLPERVRASLSASVALAAPLLCRGGAVTLAGVQRLSGFFDRQQA